MSEKIKLGIKAGESATSKLAFRPSLEVNDGLNIGYLEVSVSKSEITPDSDWEFAGKTIPILTFHFLGEKEPQAHHFETFKPISIKDIDKVKVIFDSMNKKIQHIMEVAGVPVETIEEILVNGLEFESTDTDHVITVFTEFFNKNEKAFNGDPKKKTNSVLIVNGKPQLFLFKLIRDYQRNKGKLVLPFFPGEGFIQKYVKGTKPVIKLDITKETIKEREQTQSNPFGTPNVNGSAMPAEFADLK